MKVINLKDYEKKIVDYIKKNEPTNAKQISKGTGISYPTVLKYCGFLFHQKKIFYKELGDTRIIQTKPIGGLSSGGDKK